MVCGGHCCWCNAKCKCWAGSRDKGAAGGQRRGRQPCSMCTAVVRLQNPQVCMRDFFCTLYICCTGLCAASALLRTWGSQGCEAKPWFGGQHGGQLRCQPWCCICTLVLHPCCCCPSPAPPSSTAQMTRALSACTLGVEQDASDRGHCTCAAAPCPAAPCWCCRAVEKDAVTKTSQCSRACCCAADSY